MGRSVVLASYVCSAKKPKRMSKKDIKESLSHAHTSQLRSLVRSKEYCNGRKITAIERQSMREILLERR